MVLHFHSFLNSALDRYEWSALCPTLYPMETTPVIHWDTRLCGLLNRSGCFGEEGNLLPLLGSETHIIEPIGYSLYRLSYLGSYFKLTNNVKYNFKASVVFCKYTKTPCIDMMSIRLCRSISAYAVERTFVFRYKTFLFKSGRKLGYQVYCYIQLISCKITYILISTWNLIWLLQIVVSHKFIIYVHCIMIFKYHIFDAWGWSVMTETRSICWKD